MKVLVVGGGGREHALAWKLAQSPKLQAVYVAPGNGGTALDSRLENIAITDVTALREWAQSQKIALTVVGPEQPLAAGIVDEFRAHGLRVFGPTKAAAQLESSKAFSKAFMKRQYMTIGILSALPLILGTVLWLWGAEEPGSGRGPRAGPGGTRQAAR